MTNDDVSPQRVDEWLDGVSYALDRSYMPSIFAIEFVNFIKAVNGGSEENRTPILHLHMLDRVGEADSARERIANMVFRGAAKTTLMGEYLFLYLGMYGHLPKFGRIELALYVSDSIDNGVKNMRKNLEYRYDNSDFLKQHMTADFTDIRWKFTNSDGNVFIVKGYGAKTGVRGAKEMGKRPRLAVLDDLISDEDARSPTVIENVEATIYKAIEFALHPARNMIIWSGTPFNAKDPLYKAIESGAWKVNVYPVCETFPCTRAEFRSAWPDRFTYDGVKAAYDSAVKLGKVDNFNQELMLRIMSAEDRLVQDGEIEWFDLEALLENKHAFNYYITTDFATSTKQASDISVISVWAYSSDNAWYWVDGICRRQDMGKNIDDLFKYASKWRPLSVGVEVSGQQGGFIPWMQQEMLRRQVYFNFASENNKREPGVRPSGDKVQRFNTVVPLFKLHKMHFPKQLKHGIEMQEMYNEVSLASPSGLRSKKDDFIDTISMLSVLKPIAPSVGGSSHKGGFNPWDDDDAPEVASGLSSYVF